MGNLIQMNGSVADRAARAPAFPAVEPALEAEQMLEALRLAAESLCDEIHSDRLLSRLATSARELVSAGSARTLLFQVGAGGEWVISRAAGTGATALTGVRLKPREGLAAWIAHSGQALCLDLPNRHPLYSKRCDDLREALPGWLGVPIRHGTLYGVLLVAGSTRGRFTRTDTIALEALAQAGGLALDSAQERERSTAAFSHTAELLVDLMGATDPQLPDHARGVAALTDLLTRRLGLPDSERRALHFAALIHDIGLTRLGHEVACGRWQDESLGHDHVEIGIEMLRPMAVWEESLAAVLGHHERWDGRGFPRRLSGQEIPLGARVLAIADAFERRSRTCPAGNQPQPETEAGLREMEAQSGTAFDPRLLRLFVAEMRAHGDPRQAFELVS